MIVLKINDDLSGSFSIDGVVEEFKDVDGSVIQGTGVYTLTEAESDGYDVRNGVLYFNDLETIATIVVDRHGDSTVLTFLDNGHFVASSVHNIKLGKAQVTELFTKMLNFYTSVMKNE